MEGDIKELIISGKPADSDLFSTWNTIFEEFIDGMQGKKDEQRVKDLSELDKLKWDYNFIQLCVLRLKWGHAGWIVEAMRKHLRITGKFDPTNREEYFNDLQVVLTRSNGLQHKIQELEAQLKITDADGPQSSPPSYKQFDTLIAQVSLFAKFHINRLTMPLSEFMELYRMMKDAEAAMCAQMEATKAKTSRHGKR